MAKCQFDYRVCSLRGGVCMIWTNVNEVRGIFYVHNLLFCSLIPRTHLITHMLHRYTKYTVNSIQYFAFFPILISFSSYFRFFWEFFFIFFSRQYKYNHILLAIWWDHVSPQSWWNTKVIERDRVRKQKR